MVLRSKRVKTLYMITDNIYYWCHHHDLLGSVLKKIASRPTRRSFWRHNFFNCLFDTCYHEGREARWQL